MINIPAKVKDRLVSGIKRFQPILIKAKDKDINESDTVTIVVDMLSELFGYDKYTEITSELAVKRTFCDLAIKLDGTIRLLLEVKAAGLNLKDQHIKQAVDYGSNSGVEWVILTNGVTWKVYKVIFAKPITTDLLYEIDMTSLSAKKQGDIELLYYLTREAMSKSGKATLDEYHQQKQILNKFMLGQVVLSEDVLNAIRKSLKRIAPETKVSADEIRQILSDEVIKREVLDDEKAAACKKQLLKSEKTVKRAKEKATVTDNDSSD